MKPLWCLWHPKKGFFWTSLRERIEQVLIFNKAMEKDYQVVRVRLVRVKGNK